uniref:Peptidase metallopeptidase n=1 Tax=Cyanothece sp. (strain PCC 7425 / ATCC 29141) TaxID=395961 RepID=B8HVP0_CYAP4
MRPTHPQPLHHRRTLPQLIFHRRIRLVLSVLVGVLLVFLFGSYHPAVRANPKVLHAADLPSLQTHPLPVSLQPRATTGGEDYFDQVKPTEVGYLIWSQFPIKVFVQPSKVNPQAWATATEQVIREWEVYLPLQQVSQVEGADITLQSEFPPDQGQGRRVRSAETRYQLYVNPEGVLSQRFTVMVRPNQTPTYLQAALRHELGHALGIWGHSPVATDALYFAQVRTPPPISQRDINTLVKVYTQPTRLGWPVKASKPD